MKEPVERTEVIEKVYWECNTPKHRHKTRDVALKCIERTTSKTKQYKSWTNDMCKQVVREREETGASYRKLGEKYGVSATRMNQVYLKGKRIERHESDRIEKVEKACQVVGVREFTRVRNLLRSKGYGEAGDLGTARELKGEIHTLSPKAQENMTNLVDEMSWFDVWRLITMSHDTWEKAMISARSRMQEKEAI